MTGCKHEARSLSAKESTRALNFPISGLISRWTKEYGDWRISLQTRQGGQSRALCLSTIAGAGLAFPPSRSFEECRSKLFSDGSISMLERLRASLMRQAKSSRVATRGVEGSGI